jgi:hypothetical protein
MKIKSLAARRGMRFIIVAAVLVIIGHAASASSDAAWAELAAKMTKACVKASDLDAAKVTWSSFDFDTKTTALVTGKWKPKHMKGQRAAMLCLYDKRSGRAEAQEFDVKLLK